MSLTDLRNEIDKIDTELITLLNKRMACSLEVAKIKSCQSLPVLHQKREQEILEKVDNLSGEFSPYTKEIYSIILKNSRDLQLSFLTKNNSK